MRSIVSALFLLCLATQAHAVWFLYETDTRNLIQASNEEPQNLPLGTGKLEDAAHTVATTVYPAPTAPSSCATGRKEWTRLSAGPALPLVFRTELKIFSCAGVMDAAQIKAVYLQRITEVTAALKGQVPSDALIFMAIGQAFCANTATAPGNGATCASIRSNNATLGGKIGTLADIATWQSAVLGILSDAATAITNFGF